MSKYGQQVGSGVACVNCGVSSAALRGELEVLRRRLVDRDVAIVQLEAQMMAQGRTDHYPQGQVAVLRAQCDHWQDKYDRLLEAHKRLQKVNQGLEDKLLRLVDRTESEKCSLAADTASLTTALTTAAQAINRLKQENDCYKNDLNLAIQLLQCNPSRYAAHKLDSLPSDLQKKARSRLAKESRAEVNPKTEMKVIRVPIPTFPPTAMVYSVNKYAEPHEREEPSDAVSAAIMAAVLEERQRERALRHCSTCACAKASPEGGSEEKVKDYHHHQKDKDYHQHQKQEESAERTTPTRTTPRTPRTPRTPPRTPRTPPLSPPPPVVDVGTQVLPSYIGETGKVRTTCIYCHVGGGGGSSFRGAPAPPGPPPAPPAPPGGGAGAGGRAPWEWTPSDPGGTPSTPSSMASASLSYDSDLASSPPPSPPQQVIRGENLTPPIHRSTPRGSCVVSSTATASSTETTL